MELQNAKLITPAALFRAVGVSEQTGAKALRDLEVRGEIEPARTAAGRMRLSFQDAERLAKSL